MKRVLFLIFAVFIAVYFSGCVIVHIDFHNFNKEKEEEKKSDDTVAELNVPMNKMEEI